MAEVMIVLKRNATTDPPGHPGGVLTDQGLAWYAHTPDHEGPWYSELGAYGSPALDPQPTWYIDEPAPSSEQPLTLKHLSVLAYPWVNSEQATAKARARLRAALDALTKKANSG